MKIVEHHAKGIFRTYSIPVPRGDLAAAPDEAQRIADGIAAPVVLKAQVQAGGRGKGTIVQGGKETGGGVRVVADPRAVRAEAASMLGGTLVTAQNRAGLPVESLLVEEAVEFTRQFYLAIAVDRAARAAVCIASAEGGTEIEELAAREAGKIRKLPVDPVAGWMPFHGRALGAALGLGKEAAAEAGRIGAALWSLFTKEDCQLAEINPLVLAGPRGLVALDAKLSVDDNALARHAALAALARPAPGDEVEADARKAGLSYIKLSGDIGCLVNGAGLAMATMDVIKFHGGEPANFLDVGGTASEEAVKKAFTIILSDPAVKAIFVNIFGGIMRCDVIARGIVGATAQLGLTTPLVVRLEGNQVEEGRRILRESGLAITPADGMADGARKAVAAARGT